MIKKRNEIETRFTTLEDAEHLTRWLLQPNVLQYFPMYDVREIEDAVRIWIGYTKFQSGLTALSQGKACGMANLYIQPYKKLAHQCLFSILVDEQHRGKGIGTILIEDLIKLAKEEFHIEILHLEVYEGNPAIRLYERFGFKRYGLQKHFVKDHGKYVGKIMMQKSL